VTSHLEMRVRQYEMKMRRDDSEMSKIGSLTSLVSHISAPDK
jgi:hypothetical protein